jgi:hypothetical protein
MLVCKNHYKEEPFQRFAIKIEKLREELNSSISKNCCN